jgi:hypothetical protein
MFTHASDWMKRSFGINVSSKGESITHGIQNPSDMTSCGIIVINSIAHNVFGDGVYKHAKQQVHHIKCFITIMKEHLKQVSSSQLTETSF